MTTSLTDPFLSKFKLWVKEIGVNVRRTRKQRGLTQKALAQKVKVHPSYISHIERGTQNGSVAAFLEIALALRTPIEVLWRTAWSRSRVRIENTRNRQQR